MPTLGRRQIIAALAASVAAAALPLPRARAAQPDPRRTYDRAGSGRDAFRYTLVTPDGFDRNRPYPVVVVLPPGDESIASVEAALAGYWEPEARRRGWVLVSLPAPGESFAAGGERVLPRLVREVGGRVQIEGGKVHIAGHSNGGRGALRAAVAHPDLFHSVTVLPGHFPDSSDTRRASRLRGIPVSLFVGERDTRWLEASRTTHEALRRVGVDATLTVEPGQGHVMASLTARRVFDLLDSRRPTTGEPGDIARIDASAALDALHAAGSRGDAPAFFGLFAPGAVVLGPAGERWTLAEFRSAREAAVRAGGGWPYTPSSRHLSLSPDGHIAWFDEALTPLAGGGSRRGSGVLRRIDARWLVAQYALGPDA